MFETIPQMIRQSAESYGNLPAYRYKHAKQWTDVSFNQVADNARVVAQAIAQSGIAPGERVALFLENRQEWPWLYYGIVCSGAVAVPMDAKLTPQEVEYILEDADAKLLITSAPKLGPLQEVELPTAILLDCEASETQSRQLTLSDWMKDSEEAAASREAVYLQDRVTPDDLASLIYTSGTTGRQKGAMLSHGNFCTNLRSTIQALHIDQTDSLLLVLPLHHSLAFTCNLLFPFARGCLVIFVQSIRTLASDMKETGPTGFVGVPLLLEKMLGRLEAAIASSKVASLLLKIGLKKVVFKKVRAELGGNIRLCVTGAAPCDPKLIHSYNELGIRIIEGYGLTETAPVVTLNRIDNIRVGSVGLPAPGVEVEIQNPNDQGVGEIAIRGGNVMKGYYNNPGATADVIRDGWFFSGDLGRLDDEGFLYITGRQKSLIVNREGKNIYPEEVETIINQHPLILESLVMGYKENGDTVGEKTGIIVVPDPDTTEGLSDIETRLREAVKQQARELAEYKRPRKINIRMEPFEKTSTQKTKRYKYSMDDTC